MNAGFLVLDKPLRLSSRQALDRVRRVYATRQAGFAGTLDPLATGVLVCALGAATRLLTYLEGDDKRYEATIELGKGTTTDDAEGAVVATGDWGGITREAVEEALQQFRGLIRQRPPSFSAISIGGQRLYAAARRGDMIKAPEREVTIHELELTDWRPPRLALTVHSSKGAYIRALARDLGQALGCYAYLAGLRRVASGRFSLDQAITLEQLAAGTPESLNALLLPLHAAVSHLPAIVVTADESRRIRQGQRVTRADASDGTVALFDEAGDLVAVAQSVSGAVQPEKVLSGR